MPRPQPSSIAAGVHAAFAVVSARLPFGLGRLLSPTAVGYLLINSSTFGLDLSLLWALHGEAGWPIPAAITVSYGVALATSFALNRALNFRSRAPVGRQVARYTVVVAINFLVFVLGTVDGLTRAGLDYRLARLVAAACETIFLYAALRLVVFRDAGGEPTPSSPSTATLSPIPPPASDGAPVARDSTCT